MISRRKTSKRRRVSARLAGSVRRTQIARDGTERDIERLVFPREVYSGKFRGLSDVFTRQQIRLIAGNERAGGWRRSARNLLIDDDSPKSNDLRRNASPMLQITDLDDPNDVFTTTLREFISDNREDEDTCARVRALRPGDSVEIGGGAAPWVRITRAGKQLRRNTGHGDFNASLAKLIPRLKKDLSAETIRQGYKGTGSQAHRRQIFVRFANGASIDIWLDTGFVRLGGVHSRVGDFDTAGKTPEEAYAEIVSRLRHFALS